MTTTSGLVTVLFTDVVDSTAIGSSIGDVAADELRRRHFNDLTGAIERTGGTLVKTIGDAVMVTFAGAADALNCAVEMQRAVAAGNRRPSAEPIHIRIGVSVGDATFEDDDWFGTPVIEAARLCAAAERDQILISNLVAALAGSRASHDVRAAGNRDLKGLPGPVDVSEVEWRSEEPGDGPVPLPGFVDTDPSFRFAGRAEELETVTAAWKDAYEARRRLVMISGEPGVGKTRLVTEFVRTAHDEGALVLWGRCDEALDVPFQPFAEALRLYANAAGDERIDEELVPFAGELVRLVPELATRMPDVESVPTGDADADRLRLFDAVAGAFRNIAAQDPVVLVLDDMHWADTPSLLLLKHLLRQSQPVRLLILGTYRDTDLDRSHPLSAVLADLRREQGVDRLDLDGLDAAEITAFMEDAAGHELGEDGLALAHAVHRETEGNPFFLSEMMRHLAESGYIVERDGRWVSDYSLDEVGIPEGIREVVGRRLSALSEDVNSVLAVGAAIGQEFDMSTVSAVGELSADRVLDALDEGVRASIVREVTGTFGRYAFSHAIVRTTLYEEQSTNRRVRLHHRIGTELHRRHGAAPERLDQVAHHLAEGALAGDAELAVDCCVLAAERATGELAFEAATRWYERALGALEIAAPGDTERRFEIEVAQVATVRDAGGNDLRALGLRAVATARRLDDAQRMGEALAVMDQNVPPTALDEELVALIREVLDRLGDDPTPIRARLLTMLAAQTYWHEEADEVMETAAQALSIARAAGDRGSLSAILARSWALFDATKPNMDKIADAAREVLSISPPDSANYMQALENLAAAAACAGDTRDALEYGDRFRAAADAAQASSFLWRAKVVSSMLAVHIGDLERAEQEAVEALTYATERGVFTNPEASYGSVLLYVRRAQGRSSEVVGLLRGLVESQPELPVWRIALAGACYFTRDHDMVREQFDWLVADDFARIPKDVEYPVTLCGLGRIAPAVDPPAATLERIYAALVPFAGWMNFTGTSISDANDIGLACTADLLGRHDVADGHFAAAIDLADRAEAVPYGLHYRYEWARALAERGAADRARELLITVADRARGRGMDGPDGYVAMAAELQAKLG